ncbi:MAG: hypothetical protein NZ954_07375 [Thermofilaceae archaeon]|nr:hypothetical protein [Thermofilaceae archaeon]MCX8180583.1 hypothetical protein [Thermofilaceae archaeon]MDW8003685.1 hypothetical protein [Thermofilaceae archaeon]
MPWIGISEAADKDKVQEVLENLGIRITKAMGIIELKTSRGWLKFTLYEVDGDTGYAVRYLATYTGEPVLESGPHLVLGETSARLWDEGARVVFPDGESEVLAVFTYDGFLDVRMPSPNTRGLKATMVLGGKTYELPLKMSDLLEIYRLGQKAIEKLEKAASVYGLEKIVDKEALNELKRRSVETRVEVDYEGGFVLVQEGTKARVVSIRDYFVSLIYGLKYEKIKELLENAPERVKKELFLTLKEEYEECKSIGDEKTLKILSDIMAKLGLQV